MVFLRLVLSGYVVILTRKASLYVLFSICINCKYAKLGFRLFNTIYQFVMA